MITIRNAHLLRLSERLEAIVFTLRQEMADFPEAFESVEQEELENALEVFRGVFRILRQETKEGVLNDR